MVQIKQRHFDKLIIESVRYCLGRKTYAVSECSDIVRLYWNEISNGAKSVIKRDILREIDTHNTWIELDLDEKETEQNYFKMLDQGDSILGNECDAFTWIELLNFIETQGKLNEQPH